MISKKRKSKGNHNHKRKKCVKHTIKRRLRNIKSPKLVEGGWPFSSSKTTSTTNEPNNSENNKSIFNLIKNKDPNGPSNELKTLKEAALISSGFAAAYVAVGILGASGVGLPAAGIMAIVLLIGSKIAKMYITSSQLKLVIIDVTVILTQCFYVNDYIDNSLKELEIIETNTLQVGGDSQLINDQNPVIEVYGDFGIKEMKQKLTEKLNLLLHLILENCTMQLLTAIRDEFQNENNNNDKSIDAIIKIINEEINSPGRTKSFKTGLTYSYKTLGRIYSRTMGSGTTTNDIIRELTIIQAYFFIVKSKFDEIIKLMEREQTTFFESKREEIYGEKYKTYMKISTRKQEVIENATEIAT